MYLVKRKDGAYIPYDDSDYEDSKKIPVGEVLKASQPRNYKHHKKTSKEWYEEIPKKYKLLILGADGWDRNNYEYSFNKELITKEEFKMRLSSSTIQCNYLFFKSDW